MKTILTASEQLNDFEFNCSMVEMGSFRKDEMYDGDANNSNNSVSNLLSEAARQDSYVVATLNGCQIKHGFEKLLLAEGFHLLDKYTSKTTKALIRIYGKDLHKPVSVKKAAVKTKAVSRRRTR